MNQSQKLEEYKLFVEDTARFSDRRQTASNIYVAVNSALVAGVGILVAEATKGARWLVLVSPLLLGAGIAVCVIWKLLIIRYKAVIQYRCKLLKEMEKGLGNDCHQFITKIGTEFGDTSFSDIEAKLPCVFIGVYSILAAAIVVGLCLWHDALVQALCSSCVPPR